MSDIKPVKFESEYDAGFRNGKYDGATDMRERAAKLAEEHKGKAAKDRQAKKGMRFSELPEDAQMEIQAEERGENIASEIIARDIRALPVE